MPTRFRRIFWIVLDSVGVGAAPDAAAYGDEGSDTIGNIARAVPLSLPNLCRLGLANIRPIPGLEPAASPEGAFGRCAPASPGKDTTTGHWEMAGVILERPFPLYPNGFPPHIMEEFHRRTGRPSLGNCPASGTEIIHSLGAEHMRTGYPIVYTSADSVFQVAAHEDIIPVAELYRICETARAILRGADEVGRVIARPFTGQPGAFTRTANRHDYAVAPPPGMLLDRLAERGVAVLSIGKIADIFLGRGIRDAWKTRNNHEGMAKMLAAAHAFDAGLVFANFVDFDMQYGHRNDVAGYARALEAVDAWLPEMRSALRQDDLLLLTADHGCDPTTPSTDHTREYVPVLATGPAVPHAVDLGTRSTLADMGQTIADNFGALLPAGSSFLRLVGGPRLTTPGAV